jgi:ubiquitin-conjugating enzyme E2 J1
LPGAVGQTRSKNFTMANLNNPAVKRIMGELKELTQGARPDDQFVAAPLEDNLFEWHFSIRGPAATAFDGGVYHGKIILPSEYPFKPPSITLLTPNGRFEVGKKICLSVSAHHPEHWQPAWGIRTIITALIAFMPTKAEGALAGLDYTNEERRELAIRSQAWACPSCGCATALLVKPTTPEAHALAHPQTQTWQGQDVRGAAGAARHRLCLHVERGVACGAHGAALRL